MHLKREKIITMSENEMLEFWKTQLSINPARRDCSIENEDGTDIDKFLLQQINSWYANILAKAPSYQLPQKDMAEQITMSVSKNLVARIYTPENVIHPVLLKLSSWENPISNFHSPESYMASLQYDELTRARQVSPVAIILDNKILLYSAQSQSDLLTTAVFTIRPPQGTYALAESLLSTIPTSLDIL